MMYPYIGVGVGVGRQGMAGHGAGQGREESVGQEQAGQDRTGQAPRITEDAPTRPWGPPNFLRSIPNPYSVIRDTAGNRGYAFWLTGLAGRAGP